MTWRYEAEPILHVSQNGLVTPRATIPQGAKTCTIMVANYSDEEVIIPKGTSLLSVAKDPSPLTDKLEHPELSLLLKGLLQRHRRLEHLDHATDYSDSMWCGQRMLLNQSLDQ